MKEIDDTPFDELYQIAESKGHNSKLKCFLSFKSVDQNSFSVRILFVCVEVLWPSQPNGVMSSAVSLPNHTFPGQA